VVTTGNSIVVRGSRRTWLVYFAIGAFVFGAALITVGLYLIQAFPALFLDDLAFALFGVAMIFVGIAILDRAPGDLALSPDTIDIRYLLSHVRVPWSQLRAPVYRGGGFVDFRVAPRNPGVVGPIAVTTLQARAILSYLACPKFDLPAEVVAELNRTS